MEYLPIHKTTQDDSLHFSSVIIRRFTVIPTDYDCRLRLKNKLVRHPTLGISTGSRLIKVPIFSGIECRLKKSAANNLIFVHRISIGPLA
jgi:hypothetical protein